MAKLTLLLPTPDIERVADWILLAQEAQCIPRKLSVTLLMINYSEFILELPRLIYFLYQAFFHSCICLISACCEEIISWESFLISGWVDLVAAS